LRQTIKEEVQSLEFSVYRDYSEIILSGNEKVIYTISLAAKCHIDHLRPKGDKRRADV
jgi:hypothetical protein